jgi:hypothetical protein
MRPPLNQGRARLLSLRGREPSYRRGGGESGTEIDSTGSALNSGAAVYKSAGASGTDGAANTALGPISNATSPARGSEVLRHEQS